MSACHLHCHHDSDELAAVPMPAITDDAVVQIHDFVHHFLDLFEARYGDQIHRYYQHRAEHEMRDPPHSQHDEEPPF